MKHLLFSVLLLGASLANAGNFTIDINGQSKDVVLGETVVFVVDGKELAVKLKQKATIEYRTDSYSFKHPRQYTPSTANIDAGIVQTAMFTPIGSVILVQEYTSINPSSLIDLMLNEVTKEERQYGYDISSEPVSIELSDGKQLSGKLVTSLYKGSHIKRYLLAYGLRDSGLFVMTQVDLENGSADQKILDLFFNTLAISMAQ